MNGIRCLAMVLGTALLAYGCSGPVSRVEESREVAPEKVAPGDAVTVVGLSGVVEDTLNCVAGELTNALPGMEVVRPRRFRDAMFPWFEPDLTPTDTPSLAQRMLQPMVKRRVEELRVRYVLVVESTLDLKETGWGGAIGGPGGAIVIGGAGLSEKTTLSANILDLRRLRSVDRIEVEGRGGVGAGIIVIIPYAYSVSSMKAACETIAQRVAQYLRAEPQSPSVRPPPSD